MTSQPILSIYIPTFNRAGILDRQLTILIDFFENNILLSKKIEIVISDNNSTDNTRDVIQNYISNTKVELRYNKNEENIGAIENFIQAPSKCNGKYIWLLGDDDIVIVNYIDGLIELLSNVENNIVFLESNFSLDKKIAHYEIIKRLFFQKYDLDSIGHISRIVLKRKYFIECQVELQKRLIISIWTMIIPFVSLKVNEKVCIFNKAIIYSTKDGGMGIWKFKTALPRLYEFYTYCIKIAVDEVELEMLVKKNFKDKKFIAQKYLASSILNYENNTAFDALESLLKIHNVQLHPLILLGKFLQSIIGRPFVFFIRFILKV